MDVKALTPEMLCGMQGIPTDRGAAYQMQRSLAAILARELRLMVGDPTYFGLWEGDTPEQILHKVGDAAACLGCLAEVVAGIDIDPQWEL